MARYCEKCGTFREEDMFYTHRDSVQKYPICKVCLKNIVDNEDPNTYLPILEWLNMPYFKDQWWRIKEKYPGVSALGRYLSRMKLASFKSWTWQDNERIEELYQECRTRVFRYALNRKIGDKQ